MMTAAKAHWCVCVREEAKISKSGVKRGRIRNPGRVHKGNDRKARPRPAPWRTALPLRRSRDGGPECLAAVPGALPGRSAPGAVAGGGRLQTLFGQRLHLHAPGRPEGMLLPAHAPEGLVGDRVPSKSRSERAFLGLLTAWEDFRTRGGSPGKLAGSACVGARSQAHKFGQS